MKRPNTPIEKEVLRLSLRIAIIRYELNEAFCNDVPLALYQKEIKELVVMQLQKAALLTGHYEELPYNIKQLK